VTLDVTPVAVTGTWWRHLPADGDPAYRSDRPASGRWQRGETVAALYLGGDPDTCWAEWYRRLAEDGLAAPTHQEDLMSLTASPRADAPYAATIHAVELDDFGHSFRPVAPGLFTCPIDVARLEALDDRDDLRAVLRAARDR
jgi:hypothetical protein